MLKLFAGASLSSSDMSSGIVSISSLISSVLWSSLVSDILGVISLGENGSLRLSESMSMVIVSSKGCVVSS